MHFYSFAAGGVSVPDPEEVRVVDVNPDTDDSPSATSAELNNPYMLILWSGNGHTSKNSWIACGNNYVVDLEEER
jgi:hypothetical protein